MIYTYKLLYDGLDDYGCIQFCAKTKEEAICLFNSWCIEDNGLKESIPITAIEVVYNEDDAMEYGSKYGTPKQYIA